MSASPLALRWRCSVCGKTTIMHVSKLTASCDGDTIRMAEPEVASHQSMQAHNQSWPRDWPHHPTDAPRPSGWGHWV